MLWPAWDRSLFLSVNGIDSGFLTAVMRFITNVDNWIPLLAGYILMLLCWGRTRPHPPTGNRWKRAFARRNPRVVLLCLIIATACSDQICYHIKHGVNRARPCFDESVSSEVHYRGDVHGNRSFPSAHSANSASLATITAVAYPPLAPFAILVTFLVGFSRVYLGVHYPIDVLTGWGIGMFAALGVWLVFRKMASRPGLIGFANRFRFRQPVTYPIPSTPWQPVNVESLDGYQMKGYFLRGGEDLAVIVHGLNGSIGSMVNPGEIFEKLGFSVFLVPLRGHDDHPVPVASGGPSEAYDLAGVLIHTRDNMGFTRRRTVIYGSSMGGDIALKVSGLLSESVAGVIAHGVFRNFFEASAYRMGKLRTVLLKLFLPVSVRYGLRVFEPSEYIEQPHKTRFVYINGSRDRISPPETGERLAEGAEGLALILDGAGHPVWQYNGWSKPQIETALKEALKFIQGMDIEHTSVDESGFIHDYPASPKLRQEENNDRF
ncbi:MAG: phosphatase PAP2 family protein [Candidatus Aegiribacteria sp.]|nr:phosphatase PAP2 family protein [Candidatus Aegiribacteria sp.]